MTTKRVVEILGIQIKALEQAGRTNEATASTKQHPGSTVRYPRMARMGARCDSGVFSGINVLSDTPISSRCLCVRLRAIL